MKTSYDAQAGLVNLEAARVYEDQNFGYTLFEEVVDPANPEGPPAIVMHVPPNSLSKVWQLVEPGYSERVELLAGTASLVLGHERKSHWTTMFLDADNPTADDVEIVQGDMFCIVTGDEEAVILSRPSIPFDKSFEIGMTKHPGDSLSRFVLARVALDN